MNGSHFRINLIRDTTLTQSDYRIYNASDNSEVTEVYKVVVVGTLVVPTLIDNTCPADVHICRVFVTILNREESSPRL